MKKVIATMMLLAGSLAAAPRVTFGIGFGAPAPIEVVRPVCPGPGYVWVDGYYAPNGVFVSGYWAPPAVVTVGPRFAHAPVFYHDVDHDHHFADHRFDHFRRYR